MVYLFRRTKFKNDWILLALNSTALLADYKWLPFASYLGIYETDFQLILLKFYSFTSAHF